MICDVTQTTQQHGTCNVCGTKEDILVTGPSILLAATVHWCELGNFSVPGWLATVWFVYINTQYWKCKQGKIYYV